MAFVHCSSLCLLNCAPFEQAQQAEYSHEGCDGHSSDSGGAEGCSDAFCNAAKSAYVSFPQITFLKFVSAAIPDSVIGQMHELPARLISRQPPDSFLFLRPVVYLDAANQSHAPPLSC